MATKQPRNRKSDDSSTDDAIALLTADHESVKALFKRFEKLTEQEGAEDEMAQLVQRICGELTVHATIEEEIFYPAVREAIDDDDLMDEADVEHASAKALIAELEAGSPGEDQYNAKVTVLSEYINHHVKEEEGEMFPKARKAVDTKELGVELVERKNELMSEMGLSEVEEDEEDAIGSLPRKASDDKPAARKAR
jgi:hemerythrin superfamily protein